MRGKQKSEHYKAGLWGCTLRRRLGPGPQRPYVRLAPQDEDLGHHAEELVGIGVRALQPVRSELKSKWTSLWKSVLMKTGTLTGHGMCTSIQRKRCSHKKALARETRGQEAPSMLRDRRGIVDISVLPKDLRIILANRCQKTHFKMSKIGFFPPL